MIRRLQFGLGGLATALAALVYGPRLAFLTVHAADPRLLDLWGRLGWWYWATVALMMLESYIYWRMMRGWPAEARIFAFSLGMASLGMCAALWAIGAGITLDAPTLTLFSFGFSVAGGLGTAPAFAHLTVQDHAPAWAVRRAGKGAGGGYGQ